MAYPLFFHDADEAQAYLDSCRASGNYMAENHQDRVAAQNCIRRAAGWSPPPLPAPKRAEAPIAKKYSKRKQYA